MADGALEKLAAAVPAIGAVLAVFALFHQRLYNSFFGPFPVEVAALATMATPPFEQWVRIAVPFDELEETEYVEKTYGRGGTTVSAPYRLLRVGKGELLVHIENASSNAKTLTGVLKKNDRHQELAVHGPLTLELDGNYPLLGWAIGLLGVILILAALDQVRRAGQRPRIMPPPLS
jgi:hypothetical protein